MSGGARIPLVRRLRASRTLLPMLVFGGVLLGLGVLEVLPRYQAEHLRERGGGRHDDASFLAGDGPYYRATVISLIEDHDLDLKNNVAVDLDPPSAAVALGESGAWYPKHAILMPIAAIPFYLVARDEGLLAFNLVQLSALLLLMWFGARRYTSELLAAAVTFWFAFGTMLHAAAYNFAPDVFSTLLVVAGLLATLSERAWLSGLLLGFAVWSKWTNAVFLPLPAIQLLWCRDHRRFGSFVLGAALPIGGVLCLNQHMFGSPFITPYDRVLVMQHGQMLLEPSNRGFFRVPFWSGLWTQLSDENVGLLVACPPVALAPFGAALLARRAAAEAFTIAGACVAQLATFAKYELWNASAYGPRFLLTVVALSALLVAPLVDRVSRRLSAGRGWLRHTDDT